MVARTSPDVDLGLGIWLSGWAFFMFRCQDLGLEFGIRSVWVPLRVRLQ